MGKQRRAIVIGAGMAGLATAGLLAREGWAVDLLEAHVDPGGCAATFRRKGYAFDAGATLAAGFGPHDPHGLIGRLLGIDWPIRPADPAMQVWLPDRRVTRWGNPECWREERRRAFPGAGAERFWREQETAAEQLWRWAPGVPTWPPTTLDEAVRLAAFGATAAVSDPALIGLLPRLRDRVIDRLRAAGALGDANGRALRAFCDAQLLISAQATSADTAWLYGAVALDLTRRGPVHVAGGMGTLGTLLAERVEAVGGRVHCARRVDAIEVDSRGRAVAVRDREGQRWPETGTADAVIANLPPADVCRLLGEACPSRLRRRVKQTQRGWGAFTLYLGVEEAALGPLPSGTALHQQVLEPAGGLAEGRSVFVSLSPTWDATRAPAGHRALTISTHTAVEPWWQLRQARGQREAYRARRMAYAARCLALAARALPTLPGAVRLTMPATPVTFARYTRRDGGRVGGLPQTSPLAAFPARLGPQLWLVGDHIFPGQSTAATLLGALRVAREITRSSAPP